ncbi:LysM peptidoglycan-binding domain-containing protein [Methylomonas sp. AM2-LC]|uniref:LysM peptidoglycan-binding domain-containing protein n=1 Tax=Methylomonas sp. AM2-LC TaxID=3153301 RepID=UPI003267EEA5
MVLRTIFGILLGFFFSTSLLAEELKINPNHPDQYTVVKGDTLWDISGKFLQHPWQWPKLWHNNPQIKDPHWIYPGDTLYFSYVNGEPRLSFSRYSGSGEEKMEPRIRESGIDSAIPMIPSDAIAQFLSSPKIVGKDELNNSPYIVDIGGNERLVGGAGDRLYARSIVTPTTLSYGIYRQGDPYISPQTNEILGYEALFIGDATLVASGDPATLIANKSNSQIRQGDRLMPSEENSVALNYFPKAPESQISAYIIRVMGGITQIGQHDIVVIDKGIADGLQAGHTLNIFRAGRVINDTLHSIEEPEAVKLPDEYSGVIMIFRPFERVSYALVMDALGPIHILDRVQTP